MKCGFRVWVGGFEALDFRFQGSGLQGFGAWPQNPISLLAQFLKLRDWGSGLVFGVLVMLVFVRKT